MEPVEQSSPGLRRDMHLFIRCSCGAQLVDQVARQFEDGFLHDEFGIRAQLGIPDPPLHDLVAAAVFADWHGRAAAALAAHAGELPLLHQVWLLRADTPERTGRAVYFEAGGEQYAVFASWSPTLLARKLPAGWLRGKLLPAQKESTGYVQTVIPRLEAVLPHSTLQPPDANGDIPISPRGFEDLFVGTGVTLESHPFASVFERELREFAAAAAHASHCAGPLRLYHV